MMSLMMMTGTKKKIQNSGTWNRETFVQKKCRQCQYQYHHHNYYISHIIGSFHYKKTILLPWWNYAHTHTEHKIIN